MSLKRGSTPLRGSATKPSLAASAQTQIDDLVQRNRTLEHTITKLHSQVTAEATRGTDAVSAIQSQWRTAQAQWEHTLVDWRAGCDALLACHGLVQQQTIVELEKERMNVIREMKLLRSEKLLRLQRDFTISKFQAREAELEEKIAELEGESVEHGRVVKRLVQKCAESVAQGKLIYEEVTEKHKEVEKVQEKMNKLREENATLQATLESTLTKLERATLQYDGAQSKNAELEHTNDALRRTNADITRQLDKWQNLETKGGAEADTQRKKRIELEMTVKSLEDELEKQQEIAKGRVERLKDAVHQWKAHADGLQESDEESKQQIAKLNKQVEKLEADLETERARVRPPTPRKPPSPEVVEEDLVEEALVAPESRKGKAPVSKPASSRKPSSRQQVKQTITLVGSENEAGPSRHSAVEGNAKRPSRKAKSKVQQAVNSESEVEGEEVAAPKATKRSGKSRARQEEDEDVVEVRAPKPVNKGKRKARDDDHEEDQEVVEIKPAPSKETNAKPVSGVKDAAVKRRGGTGSRAGSALPKTITKDTYNADDEELVLKKKKRKINIFPEAGAFNFGSQLADGSLNIPTVLSPVRDEPVPSRSTSVIAGIGSLLRLGR